MKRCHAFEFKDYKIVPEFISDSMPETLGIYPYFIMFLSRYRLIKPLYMTASN